jgi:hypothetical protein
VAHRVGLELHGISIVVRLELLVEDFRRRVRLRQ